MKYSFLDCFTGHTVLVAHLIFSEPLQILVLEATSKLLGGWWEEFPAVLLKPLQTQAVWECVLSCCRTTFFFLRHLSQTAQLSFSASESDKQQ